ILVDSRPSFDVFITPAFCERCSEDVLPRLAGWLSWDEEQVKHVEQLLRAAKRGAPFQHVPVQLDRNPADVDALSAHKLETAGVDWPAVPHRNYRTGTVLPHVVGYMNEITQDELDRLNGQGEGYALGDFIGRRGVERFFERRLRGKDGSRKEVVNARGETIQELSDLITGEATVASTPGDNVVLSIDMRLQAAAEKAFPGTAGAVGALGVHPRHGVAARLRPQRAHRPGDADAAGRAQQRSAATDDLPSRAAALQPGVDVQGRQHVRRAREQAVHVSERRVLQWRLPSG